LREAPGFGGVLLVAAGAEDGGVELGGGYGGGIIGMGGQGAMAGLAVHMRVLAVLLLFEDVGMAGLAGLMASESDRPGGDIGDGFATIVPILSEALRNQEPADDEEEHHTRDEYPGQAKEMSGIFEDVHGRLLGWAEVQPEL